MSESVALLLGVVVGAVIGLIAGLFAGNGKARAQQQLREQAELAGREQLAGLQREAERWRVEAEARAGIEGGCE